MKRRLPLAILSLALLPPLAPRAAAELGVTHLVFDKSVKMKKLAASHYRPFRSEPGSPASEPPPLLCGVMARGRSGRLAVAGVLRLRLVGERTGATGIWESRTLAAEVDALGEVRFGSGELSELLAEAEAAGAEIALYRLELDGGRGGRVSELTLDCQSEREGP